MTYTIKKSALAGIDNFAGMVQAYANDMRSWRAHMERVAEDERNGVTGIARHDAYPPPLAHELIAASINDQLDPDFVVEDDGPTPEDILAMRKADLRTQLAHAEDRASQSVLPAGKRRLHAMREAAIQDADIANVKTLMNPKSSFFKKFIPPWTPTNGPQPSDVMAKIASMRSPQDADFVQRQEVIRRKLAAISAVAAQAESDIEDLTVETVDKWVMPSFDDAIKGAENV